MTFERLSATLLAAQQLAGDAHLQPAVRRPRPVRRPGSVLRPRPTDPRLRQGPTTSR